MITDKLKELLTNQIVSLIDSGEVGMGGNSSSPNSESLDVTSGGTATVLAVSTDENIMEVKISVPTANIQGLVIREAGIFDASNNMLSRVNFEGVGPFASGDTLEVILIIEVE